MTGKSDGKRHDLLKSLLTPLLREWGRDAVSACIAELDTSFVPRERQRRPEGADRIPSSRKLNAVEIADCAELPTTKRAALLGLASLFNQKLFLPTASDVRHFLELRGQQPAPVKQRVDAFRKVLTLLSSMADEELERLIKSCTHPGPTQLGPLSEAIRATGAAMRSVETVPAEGTNADTNLAPQESAKRGT